MWLLTIYKPLPGSNKCKFKKYTYYRNFSKGIDHVPYNPKFSIIKESKHLGCGQKLGKIFGTFWLFWTKLPSLDLSESLMGGCKSKPFLAFYKWNHYPLSLGNLVWWGSRRLTVVTWVKGLCSGAGLLWCGYTVSSCLVWLGRFWLDSLSMTLQTCLTFPHLSALWICGVVSDCVPWGLEFLEGTLGLASLGVREARQLDCGPPDLSQPGQLAYIV